jgi:hypothetical protein
MHKFEKIDISVSDTFVQKFAEKYLEQRTQTEFDYNNLNEQMFSSLGFNTDNLRRIITKNSPPIDKKREQELQPAILNDIYRSDLGELLMTYYFEEKLPDGEQFIIPLKNITFREIANQPGRGLDAIGYKQSDGKIEILLGEAKVSQEKKSPPAVVDSSDDSLYHTQLKHKNDTPLVIQRLCDYARRLNNTDASIIGLAIVCLQNNLNNECTITYGCTLIRDHTCVNETTDFGKLQSNKTNFDDGKVHFSILSFSDKSIKETVDMFYQKVQELIAE